MEESAEKALISSWIYKELGKEEEARAYMAKALKMRPDWSLESITVSSPYKDPVHLQRALDAFRKAGMPEHPPGVVQEKPSIAVLPFDDLSPEKDQEYFVDGLSEEILNSLTKIPDLLVTARTSAFAFKGKDENVQDIAKELGVAHILEGSVRKAGDTLRITAQLIRAIDGFHLWSKSYDKELKGVADILAIQEDIAIAVANELKLTLGISESPKELGGTENLEAYELYLVTIGQFNRTEWGQAIQSIDAALELDPEFASAWALKADIQIQLSVSGPSNRADTKLNAALIAAQKAIELEPNLAEGYLELGSYEFARGNWINAELNYRKALQLRPEILTQHEIAHMYAIIGYFKKSREMLEEYRRNDPLNKNVRDIYVVTLGLLRDTKGLENENERCKELFGDGWTSQWSIVFYRLGTDDPVFLDGVEYSNPIFREVKDYLDSPKDGLTKLHQLYGYSNLSEVLITNISLFAAYFGDPEFAMDAMERGNAINTRGLFKIWYPVMKDVRQLPRFKEYMKEIGLVDYWKRFGWPDLCRPVGDDDFVCN